ncbi:desmocollin 2-like protein [Austrofundulus limnaeus]|uniref:Desmocollin 2-like protein n=1 Tax=Austrofundulus limnaeus TaxID=52670 RepID=A0A2I4D1B9_AUSLI|nr:PREDICTED: desmocollin-2-like [Austrofundulus limnaeus]
MANVLIFTIFLAVLMKSCVESCSLRGSLNALVPQTIPVGYRVAQVKAADCDPSSLRSGDPSFTIRDGAIIALVSVSMASGERTFSVRAQDNSGPGSEMEVHLVCPNPVQTNRKRQELLRRRKRNWQPPPFNILENDAGPFPKYVETIVSDSSVNYSVSYWISGKGVDEYPYDIFQLNKDTGALYVNNPLDRENIAVYTLQVTAKDKASGQLRDRPVYINVNVDDQNDNAPTFVGLQDFTVQEQAKGIIVGKVQATDKDDPNTDHARVRYKILDANSNFVIDPITGVLTTKGDTLDRETQDKYFVLMECRDMKGAPNGLFSTATATVTLSDINDNPPTFTKGYYTASIAENEKDKLLLRIPVEDKDLINTPNWFSKFVITKGNENDNFRIDRDLKTNEGLLYIIKPLDYETTKNVNLQIMVRNEAELNGTSAQWQTAPVNISVIDVDEGPEFIPPILRFPVKENTPNGTIIGTYLALDPETKKSDGITYYKLYDPGMWVNVDKNTGQLKVANTIDRESSLVQDGMYNITVRAVDSTNKAGIGTAILVIEDVNDNQPVIPPNLVLCEDKTDQLSSVLVTAEDKDLNPFSSPFTFQLLPEFKDNWSLEPSNATSAKLKQVKKLPTGVYDVSMVVKDLQGYGEKQTTKVTICQCQNGVCVAKKSAVSLGPMGALALFLPLLLLLLLFLALAFLCKTKGEKVELEDMGYGAGILLPSNTEAPGDEVDSTLMNAPFTGIDQGAKGSIKGSIQNTAWLGNKSMSTIGGHSMHDFGYQQTMTNFQDFSSGQYDQYGGQLLGNGTDSRHFFQDASYLETCRTNELLLQQKVYTLGTEGDERYAEDIVHAYGYEGAGSDAGSVGCCSQIGDPSNLDFLNTLGPKFKTLADVCTKS